MKTAILISGYLRSFLSNLPIFKKNIIDTFDNVDIYMHITKNESRDDKYYNINNAEKDISYIKQLLNPRVFIEEDNINLFSSKEKNIVYNLWAKYHKLNNLKKVNEELYGKYDLVIKYRPDLNIISENIFNFNIEQNTVYIPSESMVDRSKLYLPDDPYICDIFAFGSSHAMDRYFDIFKRIDELTDRYGTVPETLLYQYLNNNDIPYKLIDIEYNVILSTCNVFAICGDSGSGKTTLSNILKTYFSNSFTLECDRYHKWERNDENWKNYTHLNPEANYIAKMNKDIFDLKIGKSVFHVNYDHKTGKFTEQQKIEKTDNVIVCGLHSLYSNNEIYNFKIFIDTDVLLKTRWKAQRDVTERGYSYEDVLTQIKKREQDYYNFIYPQRKESDIVINFFTDDRDVINLENNINLKLKLLIKKKFNLINILSNFTKYNIPFTTDFNSDNDFNYIIFDKFVDTELISNLPHKTNSFYDYIVYTIFALHTK